MPFLRGYRIKTSNSRWYFEIDPGNNDTQPLISSIDYPTENECRTALVEFREHIKDHRICNSKSEYVNILEVRSGQFKIEYLNTKHERIAWKRDKVYLSIKACNNCIDNIYQHIDEFTRTEKLEK